MTAMDRALYVLAVLSALGSGLVAGVFFAFSTSVMKALGGLPAQQGIAAMQSINVVIINRWFMTALFGTAVTSVIILAMAVLNWSHPGSAYLVVGCLLYLVGALLVTIVFNVPLNNTLARVSPTGEDGPAVWARYVATWTRWNDIRAAASLAAAASLIIWFSR